MKVKIRDAIQQSYVDAEIKTVTGIVCEVRQLSTSTAFGVENREIVMTDDEAFLVFCWDKIVREVDRCYDIRGSDLAYLVRACLTQDGRFTEEQFEQYQQRVPAPALRLIEQLTRRLIRRLGAAQLKSNT